MFANVLVTEFAKLRRSGVPWATLGVLSLAPLGLALFMWIVREPGRAAQLGLLGAKANLAGLEATWPAFMSLTTMLVGIGGMLLLAFIVAYVFGREYVEGTAKNMLALPVGRHWFVLAKLVVALAWWLVLALAVVAESFVVGFALALPGFSSALLASTLRDAVLAAAISFLLAPVVAWITTAGRGYMPPLGFALAALAVGNLLGKTGWAAYFPWSIVPLLIGMVGSPVRDLPAATYVIAAVTFLAGIAATIAQVRWADNAQ